MGDKFMVADRISDETWEAILYIKRTAQPSAWIFGRHYLKDILCSPTVRRFDMATQRFESGLTLFGVPIIESDEEYEFDFVP